MITMVDRAGLQGVAARTRTHGNKKPVNFVARNRRALTDRSRAEAERPRKPASPTVNQSSSYRRLAKQGAGSMREETVTISKGYLDQLMRMSALAGTSPGGMMGNSAEVTGPPIAPAHVILDHSQVPGLASSPMNPTGPAAMQRHENGVTAHPPMHQVPRKAEAAITRGVEDLAAQGKTGLSAHEQWLRDLAAQAEEQKRVKEMERRKQKAQSPPEVYFPFGRPGGGAPIKSESGTLLTDYRTRGRVAEETYGTKRRNDFSSSPREVYANPGTTQPHPLPGASSTTHGDHRTSQPHPVPSQPHQAILTSPRHDSYGGLYSKTPKYARGAGPYVDRFVMEQKTQQRQKDLEHMEYIRAQIAEKELKKHEEKERQRREEREIEERLARESEQLQRCLREEQEKARRKEEEKAAQIEQLERRLAAAEEEAKRAKEVEQNAMDKQGGVARKKERNKQQEVQESALPKRTGQRRSGFDTDEDPRGTRGPVQRKQEENRMQRRSKLPSRIPVKTSSTRNKPPAHGHRPNGGSTPTRVTGPGKRRGTVQPRTGDPDLEIVSTRQRSPPVPALARKLGMEVNTQKSVATKVQRALEPSLSTPPPPPSPGRACFSPPVPALAKKLALHTEFLEQDSAAKETNTVDRHVDEVLSKYSSTSPPIPAVARKLQLTNGRPSPVHQPPSPSEDQGLSFDCLPINRPPSCSPVASPVQPAVTMETSHTHLPPLVASVPPSQPHQPPKWPNRQQRILQGLAVLRQGILSQQLDMDGRVNRILNRNTHSRFL